MKKQVVSSLTIMSILGASIVTPFNVLSEAPVEAAVLATAPKYTVPTTQEPYLLFTKTNVSNYLPNIRYSGSYLVIDITKLPKGYSLQTSLPDGTIDKQNSTTDAGVAQSIYIYMSNQQFGKNTTVGINVVSPDGKIVERNDAILTAADFIGDLTGLQDFGQKVYNLYENTLFLHLAKGITQADIDVAYAASENIASSYERYRLMGLLDAMQWEMDDNNDKEVQKQFNNANGAVSDLFVNNEQTTGAIKSTVTQSAIDAAKVLVNQLTDSTQKTALLANVQLAQNLLNSAATPAPAPTAPTPDPAPATTPTSNFVATNAVLGLFANNNPSTNTLKSTTDQQAIDAVQKLVDGVADATIRANMQVAIEQAKDLLKLKDTVVDYSLVPDDADITSTAITGTVGKGITTVRLAIDGVVKKTGKVNTDGTFSVVTENFITQGSTVEVVGYNATSEVVRKTVKVSNNLKPLVPGANEALAKQMAATAVLGLFKDNEPNTNTLKPSTAQKTIDYVQSLINVVQDATVKASMQKELDKAQVLLNASYKLTVNDTTLKATSISGTVGSGITTVRLAVDGVVKKTGQVNADGTCTIATANLLTAGVTIEVIGYEGTTEVARKTVALVTDEKPVLEGMTVDSDSIKGSVAAGSATLFRVSVNGVAVKTGTIATDGKFQSSIGKQAAGAVIKIEIKESTGYSTTRVASTTVTAAAITKLTAPKLNKMDGSYITGTAPKGTESITVYEDGAAVRAMSVSAMTSNQDGSFTFKAYVSANASSIQVQAKNSNKLMSSDLSTAFTK
ncbi:toxin Cry1Ac domain D-VI-related protein [Listeria booriae]|uniref:toxin Cry1Ac domain D-VI-related protein n=1 Tax=Listeria booriae TaxID=1552123 RepID=UPI0028803943|nr:toxin Cry1Ac domain D-VI-related protein [Listeria booriae]MDT0111511.1 toxin Cry1Ac domain D-VI-related protein [Listeria booriae]